MILSTIPDIVVLGCSGILAVLRFNSAILADLVIRGFANSFLTLAYVARPDFVLPFSCGMHPSWHGDRSDTV